MNERTKRMTKKRRMLALMDTADCLLAKTAEGISGTDPANFSALKNAAGILKELRDITMLQSPADDREQEARIAGLWKKAAPEADKNTHRTEVVMLPEPESWGD